MIVTCKECLHNDVCRKYRRRNFPDEKMDPAWCKHFKSKDDVVEVKHGEWVCEKDGYHRIYECSLCKDKWSYGAILHMNYCPNCGAKMYGKEVRYDEKILMEPGIPGEDRKT